MRGALAAFVLAPLLLATAGCGEYADDVAGPGMTVASPGTSPVDERSGVADAARAFAGTVRIGEPLACAGMTAELRERLRHDWWRRSLEALEPTCEEAVERIARARVDARVLEAAVFDAEDVVIEGDQARLLVHPRGPASADGAVAWQLRRDADGNWLLDDVPPLRAGAASD